MIDDNALSQDYRQYVATGSAQDPTKDLHAALELYLRVLTMYPKSPEAEYFREQIRNIARSVIPTGELLDTLVVLARTRLKQVIR